MRQRIEQLFVTVSTWAADAYPDSHDRLWFVAKVVCPVLGPNQQR
jgi:hypothetical protein